MKDSQVEITYKYEQAMEMDKWNNEIPFIQFPSNWQVKIIAPFAGAVVRFRVKKVDSDKEISVYLDCYDRLGYVGEPYWEIYPYQDDVFRCLMNEIPELIAAITEALA